MVSPIYKGYSSFEFEKNDTFLLTDVELVKLDLLNHIFTRLGERVMMPTFGTLIPDLIFEPLDDDLVDLLESELQKVFDFDPRVEVIDLIMTPNFDESRVEARANLKYIELAVIETLDLNIAVGESAL